MLSQKDFFWKHESEAPLLKKNYGFIKPNEDNETLTKRASQWSELLKNFKKRDSTDVSKFSQYQIEGEPERIFVKDAERTFFGDQNRQHLIRVLSFLSSNFQDYAQAASYVTSFLLLTLPVDEVVDVVLHLNNDEDFLAGNFLQSTLFQFIFVKDIGKQKLLDLRLMLMYLIIFWRSSILRFTNICFKTLFFQRHTLRSGFVD